MKKSFVGHTILLEAATSALCASIQFMSCAFTSEEVLSRDPPGGCKWSCCSRVIHHFKALSSHCLWAECSTSLAPKHTGSCCPHGALKSQQNAIFQDFQSFALQLVVELGTESFVPSSPHTEHIWGHYYANHFARCVHICSFNIQPPTPYNTALHHVTCFINATHITAWDDPICRSHLKSEGVYLQICVCSLFNNNKALKQFQ